ncbi:transforming growth factor-beta receptor-associated protein 1-like isoform X2 [Neocloeon triangulifer]|uniref:transforming growth factor-beta receptor-associated protein 1-like isoform X2 n=1 Tax=Neocloeon triangulifer TaxID=2078957 RepID=UPI00286F4D69|nr:transforming growth factor-beta receptor-associated protein 1-like isoform X2 [Neocloeon triangulifer]
MSIKSFDCIPVLETSQLLADLRPQTKIQIESIESCGSELFLGTYDGLILVYNIQESLETGGKTKCFATKNRERYLSTRKPIKSIKAASASERLLIMSNNTIFLLSMSSLEPVGSQLQGVTTICVNENPSDIDDPFATQICVATKKKIEVHNANESKFSLITDVATSEPVVHLGIDGSFICVALMTKYKIFNFKTKVVQELFDFPPANFFPIVRRIQQGEFLLTASEGLGMFVTTEGLSNRAPIQWMVHTNFDSGSSGVIATAYFHPYILALCGNFIVVHSILDQQQKQSEPFSGGVALGNFDGRLYVCTSKSVYRLCPVAWEKQVQALLCDKKVDEALDLIQNANYTGYSREQFEKMSQRIKQQASFIYFSLKDFDRAREMFIESNVDVREVISLFPNLLPQSSSFVRAIPPLHEIADVDQLFQKDSDAISEAQVCLRQLLEDLRDPSAPVVLHQFELDTALVKLYAESNKDSLAAFILAGDVQCDTKDCLQWLEELGCFNSVALLHKQSKNNELALEYWARLASGEIQDDSFQGMDFFAECLANTKDMDLVWRHAAFVLDKDEESGAKIFTCRSTDQNHIPLDVDKIAEYLQKYPRALVNYLEYIVLEEKNQDEKFHSRLAVIYLDSLSKMQKNGASQDEILRIRKKFQRFLQESNLYRVQTVLAKIKGMGLDRETATLHGKLGEHDKALTILVHRLKDYTAAEEYCEANSVGKDKKSSEDLFHSLLNCYLDQQFDQDDKNELVKPALDLINRKAKMFNVAKVLERLPQGIAVPVVDSFLCGALRSSMHKFRMKKVEASLAKGENIQRRHVLYELHNSTVFLQDNNYCFVCKKPFQDGSFARYPNNVITHIACAKQNDVCPVTGRIFRSPDKPDRSFPSS